MAGEKKPEQINERRRRRRSSGSGSNLTVNFNGGGVILLLGAAAGTLLASAFAARRILAHKRRRGSMTDEKIQVNSDENLDASFQISEAGERDSNADISSSPTNAYCDLGIGSCLGGNQLRYCDNDLVVASVKEESKFSCLTSKEDYEGRKMAYKAEQSELLEHKFGNHLHLVDEQENGGANTREQRVQANSSDDLHRSHELLDFIKRESDVNLVEIVAERNSAEETKLLDGIEELACLKGSGAKVIHHLEIGSSQANVHNNLEIYNNLGEDQLRHDEWAESFSEEIEAPFINREEDEEDNKKAYIEEWGERKELEEKTTHSNLNMKDLCLPDKKAFQGLELVVATEESKFEYGFMDEIYNSILEIVLSRAKEMTTSSPFGNQDEINGLLFGMDSEAKEALDMTQYVSPFIKNDSGKHLEMMIMESKTIMESGAFKDVVRLLGVEQEENGDATNDRIIEESRGLCEQTGALPQESSITIVSEPEMNSPEDSIVVIAKEDNGIIVHNQEDKMKVDESNYPLVDEGVEGLHVEIQGIEDCNKLNNFEKTLESKECQASNQEVEREDEIISVQFNEIETKHYIEAHNDKLERETEFPQIKESQAQIKEEAEETQNLKLSFDLVEKGVKITNKAIKQDTKAELIDLLYKKHQCQVESYEKNVSSKGKQQRIAIKKAKVTEYKFMRYRNVQIFLLTTLTTAILVLVYAKYFLVEPPFWKIASHAEKHLSR